MGEAGPSGVDHNTTQPMPANAAGTHDNYGLSKLRCSHRITDYVDQVGQQQWGSNHVWQFILDEEESKGGEREGGEREGGEREEGSDEKEEQEEEQLSNEEDHLDSLELDDEYVKLGAEPGQEGVSVWDLLG